MRKPLTTCSQERPMADNQSMSTEDLIALTTEIVTAHVSNNNVKVEGVPELISTVYGALAQLGTAAQPEEVRPEPAVSVRASIKRDHLVCLEDGKKMKMLK